MSYTSEQQELLRMDFNYAIVAMSVDEVDNIIALRPLAVNQPGKNAFHSSIDIEFG